MKLGIAASIKALTLCAFVGAPGLLAVTGTATYADATLDAQVSQVQPQLHPH